MLSHTAAGNKALHSPLRDTFIDRTAFDAVRHRYRARLLLQGGPVDDAWRCASSGVQRGVNPAIVLLRNWLQRNAR